VKSPTVVALLSFVLLVLFLPARRSDAATTTEYTGAIGAGGAAGQRQSESPPPDSPMQVERSIKGLGLAAGRTVQSLAERANEQFAKMAASPVQAWCVLILAVVVGMVSLLYGWAVVKSFLVPFAPVWGLALGAVTSLCLVQAFASDKEATWRLAIFVAGSIFGVSLFMFAALRAKPVAVFLVTLSPFIIAAAFLMDLNAKIGIIVCGVGFLAGFAAMIEVRPISIASSAIMGALCFLMAHGLLSHLWGDEESFPARSFTWLTENPLMLLMVVGVLSFLGTNFQLSTGPRGTLES